jgi:hypothetical protein
VGKRQRGYMGGKTECKRQRGTDIEKATERKAKGG